MSREHPTVDITVIRKIQTGDLLAFKILYHAYYPKIYAFIKKHVQSVQDSEELTQDIFLKIWNNRTHLVANKSFDGFIFKVSKNAMIDYFRKKRPVNVDFEQDFTSLYPDPESILEEKELEALTEKAIEKLPLKRKEIFLLSRKEGLTYSQIAQKLGISVKTVEAQMRLALKSIRQELGGHANMALLISFCLAFCF